MHVPFGFDTGAGPRLARGGVGWSNQLADGLIVRARRRLGLGLAQLEHRSENRKHVVDEVQSPMGMRLIYWNPWGKGVPSLLGFLTLSETPW